MPSLLRETGSLIDSVTIVAVTIVFGDLANGGGSLLLMCTLMLDAVLDLNLVLTAVLDLADTEDLSEELCDLDEPLLRVATLSPCSLLSRVAARSPRLPVPGALSGD